MKRRNYIFGYIILYNDAFLINVLVVGAFLIKTNKRMFILLDTLNQTHCEQVKFNCLRVRYSIIN